MGFLHSYGTILIAPNYKIHLWHTRYLLFSPSIRKYFNFLPHLYFYSLSLLHFQNLYLCQQWQSLCHCEPPVREAWQSRSPTSGRRMCWRKPNSFSDLWLENVLAKANLVLRPLVGECVGESQTRSPTSGWRMCWRKPNSFSDLWLENVLAKAKLLFIWKVF